MSLHRYFHNLGSFNSLGDMCNVCVSKVFSRVCASGCDPRGTSSISQKEQVPDEYGVLLVMGQRVPLVANITC